MTSPSVLSAKILLLFIVGLPFLTAQATCNPSYGTGITRQHCKEALSNLPLLMFTQYAERYDHPTRSIPFSRDIELSVHYHPMPLILRGRKCSFGIDLIDPAPPSRLSSFKVFIEQMQRLIHECVDPHGYGGRLEHEGFEYLLVNSEQKNFKMRFVGDPDVSLSHFIVPRAGVVKRGRSAAGLSSILQGAGDASRSARRDESPQLPSSINLASRLSTLPPRKRPVTVHGLSTLRLSSPDFNLPSAQQQLTEGSGEVNVGLPSRQRLPDRRS